MDGGREADQSSIERPGRFQWPWADIIMRILVWLILGIAINTFPPFIAFIIGAGDPRAGGHTSLTGVLSSGDLLIATTAILPPALADLQTFN